MDELTIDDMKLGLESSGFPFATVATDDEMGWTQFAFRDDPAPVLALRGEHCLFRRIPSWRTVVTMLLFHRLMRMRRDAIFLHAASLGVHGRGLLLIGPKGAGKSTLALALAARGHAFLGDEIAGFLPASGELIAFRRPVGIKPGPRARQVAEALAGMARSPEREGLLRIPIEELTDPGSDDPLPLCDVVFLKGLAARLELRRVEPSREDLAQLQPVVGSLVNSSPAVRVLQMVRLLDRARVYHVHPGDPDETAEALERLAELQ